MYSYIYSKKASTDSWNTKYYQIHFYVYVPTYVYVLKICTFLDYSYIDSLNFS